MPSLGSVTEGMIGTQLDLQNIQLNQFKLQEAPIKLESERVELMKDKISLAQSMRLLSLMQDARIKPGDQNDPDAMAGYLDQMAMFELESGMVDAAAKTSGEAAKLRDTASKVTTRQYRVTTDRLSRFYNVLGSVPDTAEGFRQAIATELAVDPTAAKDPKFQEIAKMPWRPGLVPMLQRSVLTAKEQAEINYRKQAGDHAEAAAEADRKRVPLIEAQTRRQNQWLKDHEKNSGPNAPLIKGEELRTITDMADVDYPGSDPSDVRVRSRNLVIEAKQMAKANSLTYPEAARRVYENARSKGVFSGLRQMPAPKGSKPGKPLALPQAKDEKDFTKKLQENQWYDVDGETKLYMDGKFYSEKELQQIDQDDKDELNDDEEDDEEAQE